MDAPRFRSAPTIFDEAAPPSRALVDSPVSRLQPRTVGQLLDGGFEVLRFRFRTVAIVAATIVLPLYAVPQALVAAASGLDADRLELGSSRMFTPRGEVSGDFWTTLGLSYLAQLGLWFATMLMGVAVAHLVSGWLIGHDPTPADTLRFVRSRFLRTLGAFVLVLLLKLAGAAACGLGLIYLVPALSVLAPVIASEDCSATEAIGRAFRLTRRRFGPVLGVSLLWWLASSVVSTSAGGAAALIGGLATGSEDGAVIGLQVVSVAATAVLTVVQVAVTVLVYVDLRVRTEGLDLELESVERFGAVAG